MNQLTYKELLNWQKENKSFQLIDVREEEEHEAYNIGGILLPLPDLMKLTDQLDTSLPIVIYCKRGIRSQIAIQRLSQKFPEVDFYNLQSGIPSSKP